MGGLLKTVEPWLWMGGMLALLIGAGATTLTLPGTERRLAELARAKLVENPHDYGRVGVSFSGQEATLTGRVETEETRRKVLRMMRGELRALGCNPVTAVWDELEIDPYLHALAPAPAADAPQGFLLWTADDARVVLFGRVADEFSKEDAMEAAARAFPQAVIDGNAVEIGGVAGFVGGMDFGTPTAGKHAGVLMPGEKARRFPAGMSAAEIRRKFPDFSFPPGVLESALETPGR